MIGLLSNNDIINRFFYATSIYFNISSFLTDLNQLINRIALSSYKGAHQDIFNKEKYLNGHVNRHETRYWSDENLH